MHVAVFPDIEGAFGIWRMRQCHTGTPEWQYGRECLTLDVNQVIRGAFEGGAGRVTVKDTHDTGFNCLLPRLDARANYIGGHFVKPTFFGNVTGYDLVLYVAIHAASGTPDAFFPHTHYGVFADLRVNGHRASEMDIYGGYLGEFGVPVGFVSGEKIAVDQAKASLPWARTVEVDKRKSTYTRGKETVQYLAEGRERLRQGARLAVQEADRMRPLIWKGPLEFSATFRNKKLADKFNTWDFTQKGETVRFEAPDMKQGFHLLNKLTFFPKRIYPIRRQVAFAARTFYSIKNHHFYPKPNREGAGNR